MQRDIGDWTIFSGGGYSINSGAELRNSVFLRLAAWHSASESLSLGAEVFHATPDRPGAARLTGFNLGAIYELGNERRHRLLVSAGAGISVAPRIAPRFSLAIR